MLIHTKLDYDFDVFLKADYSVHSGSCISHQVHELTDIHEAYGGFPEKLQKLILKDVAPYTDKPNAHLAPINFENEIVVIK